MVKFLIDSGVDIHAEDVQRKTALHYAVQENRLESAKHLLDAGADPYKKSKYGDDILQTACLKGSLTILNFLLEAVTYEPERIAEAFELIGATFLMEIHDMGSSLFFWRKALEIRYEGRYTTYPKKPYTHPVLQIAEINSKDELEAISSSPEALKYQGVLMSERILGSYHKDTIFRYMFMGAAFADANDYQPCVSFWNYALWLKVRKETLLSCDTSFTAKAVVQIFVNMVFRGSLFNGNNNDENEEGEKKEYPVRFEDVLATADHLNSGIINAVGLLSFKPQCQVQAANFDGVMITWLHLLLILLKMAKTDWEKKQVNAVVGPILRLNPRNQHGENVLHLSVKSVVMEEVDPLPLFPNVEVTEYLLDCGYSVEDRNGINETPLHLAAKTENFSAKICSLLLDSGAHLDLEDDRKIKPSDIFKTHSGQLNLVPYVSLKCLATQALLKIFPDPVYFAYLNLPRELHKFLALHICKKKSPNHCGSLAIPVLDKLS